MTWQPMASAPRDGRRFVAGLWVRQDGAAHFEMHIIRAARGGEGVHPDDDRGWAWVDYAQWLPLPIPPASGADTAASSNPGAAVSPMHKAYGLG